MGPLGHRGEAYQVAAGEGRDAKAHGEDVVAPPLGQLKASRPFEGAPHHRVAPRAGTEAEQPRRLHQVEIEALGLLLQPRGRQASMPTKARAR